jgi:hypothetical protein
MNEKKETRPSKANLRFLVVIIICVLGAYYGYLRFNYEVLDSKHNIYGDAVAEAIQLAFDQHEALESKTPIPKAFLAIAEKECPRSSIGYCFIANYRGTPPYYCQKWRLEECASISASAFFKEHPPLLAALESIVKEPCKYMPATVEAKSKFKGQLSEEIYKTNYQRNRYILGCSTKPKFFKTIISFREYNSEQPILMYSGK